MRVTAMIGLTLLLSTGAAFAADPGPDNLELACSGAFGADADRDRLVAVFGAANVVDEDIDVGEGMTEPGTVLYPADPERRVQIFWGDGERKARPLTILVREDASRWRGPAGIGIGTTLSDVEAANGRPFDVVGFDWDFGGYAGDWKGGALATITGDARCPFSVRFGPTTSGDYAVGDEVFLSSSPGIRAATPVVQSFGIGWAQQE